MAKIGFIGLGQMGFPMAACLIKHNHQLCVFDIDSEAVNKMTSLGACAASSAEEAARGSDFVITMLPNGELVEKVIFSAQGVIDGLDDHALLIDMSTIHPLESERIRLALEARGKQFMDAPVGRTSEHAVNGELLILAGGSDEQIDRASEVLLCMGNEIIRAGGPGKGIAIKLVNNFMSAALNALSGEAVVLAEKLGLEYATVEKVFSGTPAGKGHFTTTWPNKLLKGDLSPVFMLALAQKDLGIVMDLAGKLNVPMPMGAAATTLYTQAKAHGRGQQDWTAIVEEIRASAQPN
ncbi:sulfolactaldehyde 3-reductase [Vibrio rhodolitus]|uniref:sulfolactaldehyde 3-reductase n=1 Tax=Vibrio rhodolitus TaxID=2231649 RepID=UPI000E0A5ADD|nr:sulfolactaldehyde 3-reductase [Vibrio rhodolitus]